MAQQYIGSHISLISKSDIRYSGILNAINSEEATISLEKVRSLGSEDRKPPEQRIPPSDTVYDFIVFKASDIRDLKIEQPLPPPIPDDPAILNQSRPQQQQNYGGFQGYPPASPYGNYGLPPPGQHPYGMPQYPGFHPGPPGSYSPYGPPMQHLQQPPMNQQGPGPMGSSPALQQQQRTEPPRETAQQELPKVVQPQAPVQPQPAAPAAPKPVVPIQAPQVPIEKKPEVPALRERPPQPQAPISTPAAPVQKPVEQAKPQQSAVPSVPRTEIPEKQQPIQRTNGAPQSFAQAAAGRSPAIPARPMPVSAQSEERKPVTATQVEQLAADLNRIRPPSASRGRGARGSARGPSGPRAPSQNTNGRLPEFDFEATAQFEKKAEEEKAQTASGENFYQKESSFFDTISSDLSGGNGKERFDRGAETKRNVDTFGEEARTVRPGGRGKPRGRGGRGRGRGAPRGGLSATVSIL